MAEYTLHLGDCLEYMRGMEAGSVDAVVTDPPYGDINHIQRLHERAKYKNGPIRKLYKDGADDLVFSYPQLCFLLNRISRSWIVVFAGDKTGEVRTFFSSNDCMTRIGFWEKTSPSPLHGQYIYTSAVEPMMIARKRGAAFNAFCKPPVFRSASDIVDGFPTPKPLKVIKEIVADTSRPGDTVFDPFMGSGTTGVACMQLGRNFIGCEIDPGYYAIAEKRIREASLQPPLFVPEPSPKPQQAALLE